MKIIDEETTEGYERMRIKNKMLLHLSEKNTKGHNRNNSGC